MEREEKARIEAMPFESRVTELLFRIEHHLEMTRDVFEAMEAQSQKHLKEAIGRQRKIVHTINNLFNDSQVVGPGGQLASNIIPGIFQAVRELADTEKLLEEV